MANWQVISLDTVTPQLRAPGTGDGYSFNSGATQLGVWTTTGLGIGTASPAATLSISKQSTALSGTGNSYGLYLYPTSSGLAYIDCLTGSGNNTSLAFRTYNNGTYNTLTLDNAGNVGIGTASPTAVLSGSNVVVDASATAGAEFIARRSGGAATLVTGVTSSNTGYLWMSTNTALLFGTNNTERMRLDSSGRLLVGGTSAVVGSANGSIEVQNANTVLMGLTSFTAASSGPNLFFSKSRGATVGTNTIVQSGDTVGAFVFRGANGTGYDDAAYIIGSVDGTPGASADMPGRLTFWTTPDGSASPTERMRISNAGNVVVNTAAVATTATDGFLYIPGCAGTPTGTPTAYTGRVPLVVDTTNNKLYFYSNGAWRDAGP